MRALRAEGAALRGPVTKRKRATVGGLGIKEIWGSPALRMFAGSIFGKAVMKHSSFTQTSTLSDPEFR